MRSPGPRKGSRTGMYFLAGIARANNTILGLFGAPAGTISVLSGFASGTVNVVIDVNGGWAVSAEPGLFSLKRPQEPRKVRYRPKVARPARLSSSANS